MNKITSLLYTSPIKVWLTLAQAWRIFLQIRHLLLVKNLQQAFRNFYKIKSSIIEINLVISRTKMNQIIYSRRSTLCRLRSRNALIFSHTPRLTLAIEEEGITRKGKKKSRYVVSKDKSHKVQLKKHDSKYKDPNHFYQRRHSFCQG